MSHAIRALAEKDINENPEVQKECPLSIPYWDFKPFNHLQGDYRICQNPILAGVPTRYWEGGKIGAKTQSLKRREIMGTTFEKIEPSTTKLGWIGTGVMGRWMCQHLMDLGYGMTVYNRTKSKADPLLEAGADWSDSPSEVAAASDIVFTIVGFPPDVREVYPSVTVGS